MKKVNFGKQAIIKAKLYSIPFYGRTVVWGEAVFYTDKSLLYVFSVKGAGKDHDLLFLMKRNENNAGQLFQYKHKFLFNQVGVLDVPAASREKGKQIITYGRHGGSHQQWEVIQK